MVNLTCLSNVSCCPTYPIIVVNRLNYFLLACFTAGVFSTGDTTAATSSNTIVRFQIRHGQTIWGNVDVELFDSAKPITVSNFLSYVRSGSFDRSILHRAVPGFVVQGGLYTVPNPYVEAAANYLNRIPEGPAISSEATNSPIIPNTFGTLAMSLSSTATITNTVVDRESATTSWYFNTGDNSTDLPEYTVFGKVKSGSQYLTHFNTISEDEGIINMYGLNYLLFSDCDLLTIDTVTDIGLTALPVFYFHFACPRYIDLFNVQISVLKSTGELTNRTLAVGQEAFFSVEATAVGTLSYQWYKDDASIPGATNTFLLIPAVTDSDAGTYSVVASNAQERVTTDVAILTVLDTPLLATHPVSQTVDVGSTAALSATAYGVPPLVFQWYFNGSPVGAATAGTNVSVLTLSNVQTNQSGSYRVQVINAFGSATSSDAALNVVIFPPSIALQPSNQNPLLGGRVTFTVSVTGRAPFRYQWLFNDAAIPGATNSTFTIPAVAQSDAGNYSVVVSNSSGSVTSGSATLTVIVPPSLGLQLLAGYPVLRLNGMVGSNFSVQYVTDLSVTNWLNLRSISNLTVSPFQFLDAAGGTSPARYYRAVMQ